MSPTPAVGAESYAWYKVRGTVVDARGYAVPEATVRLVSEVDTLTVATDSTGRFETRLRAARAIKALVRSPGYREIRGSLHPQGILLRPVFKLPPPYRIPVGSVIARADAAPWRGAGALDPAACQ